MRAVSPMFLTITGVAAAALLVGCNATDTNTGSNSGTTNSPAAGVWSGSDSVSGLGLVALINSAGQAIVLRSDGVLFSGTAQVSGNALALTVDGYSAFPAAFSDGSTYGIGTANGTVMTGSSISANMSITTNGGTAITGNWSLSYSALSNDSSSTSMISGNYADSVTGAVLSINSNGSMNSQNANNGCVLNGSVSTTDSSLNIYQVSYSFGNCTGAYAALNGVQFTGLATLNPSSPPAQITMAVTGASTANQYAIISTLNGS
jgi:hypothetical protein